MKEFVAPIRKIIEKGATIQLADFCVFLFLDFSCANAIIKESHFPGGEKFGNTTKEERYTKE